LNNLTESAQDYIKVLLDLSKKDSKIHSAEVAATLGVSRASVSRAMSMLKDNGYIKKEKYGTISLTKSGLKAANIIKRRNEILTNFMIDILGVNIKVAKEDACRMEHDISAEAAYKLEEYLEYCAGAKLKAGICGR
jgi:Mn-dependent DtxR family transcriptional regulator